VSAPWRSLGAKDVDGRRDWWAD